MLSHRLSLAALSRSLISSPATSSLLSEDDIRLRQSDFALGYMSMQKWLADNLGRLTRLDVADVLAAVDAAKHPGCTFDPVAASTPWSRVTVWERIQAMAVAAHFAKIAIEG